MPLPPQAVKALMDLSTGRTATPITLPPPPPTAISGLSPPSSIASAGPYPGYIGPLETGRDALRKDDDVRLKQDLAENATPDDFVQDWKGKSALKKELEQVPDEDTFKNHSYIPGSQGEAESVET